MRKHKHWTHCERARLRELVASGMRTGDIAVALGRPVSGVYLVRSQCRIPDPHAMRGVCAGKAPRSDRIVEVLRAAVDPVSPQYLAAAVYGEATAANIASLRVLIHGLRRRGVRILTEGRRYRLDCSPTPVLLWSDRRDAEALSMHSRGVPAGRIARRLGLPTDAVARRLCILEMRRRAA